MGGGIDWFGRLAGQAGFDEGETNKVYFCNERPAAAALVACGCIMILTLYTTMASYHISLFRDSCCAFVFLWVAFEIWGVSGGLCGGCSWIEEVSTAYPWQFLEIRQRVLLKSFSRQ